MAWKESSAMDERLKFITRWSSREEENFAALCREFGISRKTGYKWVERYEHEGVTGLEQKNVGRPEGHHKVSPEIVSLVLETRKSHPTWGARKVKAYVEDKEGWSLPSASTIGAWFKQYGQISPRKRRLRVGGETGKLTEALEPNDVWALDFKGDFVVGDGRRIYPWTLTDVASRYLLKCEGCENKTEAEVKKHCERAFVEYGLPGRLLMDNGTPWVTRSPGGLSGLMVWWVELGIVPERIEPGHPEQNGRHERMHRTLKAAVCVPARADVQAQQRAFDLFRREFNDVRPHEALGQKPPARVYMRSYRPYPAIEREPEYERDYEVRRSSNIGQIWWQGGSISVGRHLYEKPIGIKTVGDRLWDLYYGPLWIMQLRQTEKKELRIRLTREPGGPEKVVGAIRGS